MLKGLGFLGLQLFFLRFVNIAFHYALYFIIPYCSFTARKQMLTREWARDRGIPQGFESLRSVSAQVLPPTPQSVSQAA
jgi:hypothetical protein